MCGDCVPVSLSLCVRREQRESNIERVRIQMRERERERGVRESVGGGICATRACRGPLWLGPASAVGLSPIDQPLLRNRSKPPSSP